MTDFLGSLVRKLRGKSAPETHAEQPETVWTRESVSKEARLRVVPGTERVEFFSLITGERLFGLPARLTGPPVKSTESADRGQKQVVLSVPLPGNRSVRVTFQSPPEVEPEEVETARASQARVPPDSSMVEFLLTREEHEFRYVFEFPDGLSVQDFEPVPDRRPVFRTVPPVAQMAAFLRAMTQHRRSALACLEDVARTSGSPRTRDQVVVLAGLYPRSHEFSCERLRALEKLLRRSGRIVHPAVLAALAIFVELEQERLSPDSLEPGGPLEVSARSCYLVARHFNVEPSSTLWEELFGEPPEDAPAEELREALRKSTTSRTHLDILSDLARESKSQRVAAFVDAVRRRLPLGQFQVNDEQVALGALLASSGIPVHGNTLTALCLFVDIEVGVLSQLAFDRLIESGDRVDTSMYAMVAVAGAFDLGLRGFSLEQATEDGLKSLLQLAGGRLMARFVKAGQEGFWWEYLGSAAEVTRPAREGLTFTGHVLGRFAVIDQLNERDLEVFNRAGRPMMACFSADYDRTILWKKLGDEEPSEQGKFTFIKGFTAFSFNRMVMAGLESGRPRGPVVIGELDARGNYSYRFLEDPAELPEGWNGKLVAFPEVDRLPELMYELGQDPLLGRSEALLEEARTLEQVHSSVGRILSARPAYLSLIEQPELLASLQQLARSPALASATSVVLDGPTREGLVDLLSRPQGLKLEVYEPLARAVDTPEELEFLTLHVLFALAVSEEVQLERRFKQYDEARFRQLLRTRLHGLLDSPQSHTRALAVRLMATAEEIRDRNDRLIAQYELSRARQDSDPEVVLGASEALGRLALEQVMPLPEIASVSLSKATPAEPVETVEPPSDQELHEMKSEIRAWLVERAGLSEQDKRRSQRELARKSLGSDGQPEEEAVERLAEFLVALNRAVGTEGHCYFCMLRANRVGPIRAAVFDSWRVFALSKGSRLSELVFSTPALELRMEYQDFLEVHGAELSEKFGGEAPFLGGPAGPITVYHLNPGERFGTWRRRESSFVEERREESPFFLSLLERLEEMPRILQVERAGGVPLSELESHLASFTTERIIEPWEARILQPGRFRFAPFLHRTSLRRDKLTDEEDLEDFEALLHLLHGHSPRPAAPATPVEAASPSREAPAEESPAAPSFKDLAASLAQYFDLPKPYQKQVINILLDVGSQSIYDL
ncbi:MAG: hypothetical protein AMXMBFR33_00360 [Candidatus Xenobia bacterium]